MKCEVCNVNNQTAWFRLKEVCGPCFIRLKRKANINGRINLKMDNARVKLCNCANCKYKREYT